MGYYDDVRAAVDARFQAQWDVSDAVISWDNVPFDTPSNAPWVRLFLLPSFAPNVSLGPNPLYRHMGIISIQCFTPENTGSGVAFDLAQKAMIIFRGQSFSGIVCRKVEMTRVGLFEGWYQTTVHVHFYYDSTN